MTAPNSEVTVPVYGSAITEKKQQLVSWQASTINLPLINNSHLTLQGARKEIHWFQ